MISTKEDINCSRCQKKLAVKSEGKIDVLQVRNGKSEINVYEAKLVAIKCERCNQVNEVQ